MPKQIIVQYKGRDVSGEDRVIDDKLSVFLGWVKCQKRNPFSGTMTDFYYHDKHGCQLYPPNCSDSLDALRPVLDEIERRGLKAEYLFNKLELVHTYANIEAKGNAYSTHDEDELWAMEEAPPHVDAVAMLITLEGE
jgi:hypothetical protein